METKMITIPFDVELAKEIQAGIKPGKITSRGGRDARIVCWDRKAYTNYHIVALLDTPKFELVTSHTETGESDSYNEYNLMLQVPEWTQFKDGDVLACEVDNGGGNFCKWYSVLKGMIGDDFSRPYITSYVDYNYDSSYRAGELIYDDTANNIDSIRLATEEEKQQLIDALKQSTDPRAKEYLKRFFGIEEKEVSEQKLDFLQPVLVRANPSYQWLYGNFTHMSGELHLVSGGIGYKYCIPYNEHTKHLLGTTNKLEEQQ